jgi:hypothetical protein
VLRRLVRLLISMKADALDLWLLWNVVKNVCVVDQHLYFAFNLWLIWYAVKKMRLHVCVVGESVGVCLINIKFSN